MAKTYSNHTRDKQEVKAITDQLEEGLKELFAKEKYKSYLFMMPNPCLLYHKKEQDKVDPVTGEIMLDKDGIPEKVEIEIRIPAFLPLIRFVGRRRS